MTTGSEIIKGVILTPFLLGQFPPEPPELFHKPVSDFVANSKPVNLHGFLIQDYA